MKKSIFVFLASFVLFTTGAMAQDVRFGIRAGLNQADWQGDANESANSLLDLTQGYASKQARTGFHAGVYAHILLTPRFALEPGLQYSQKGSQLKGNFVSESLGLLNAKATVINQSSYLDVPVLAKVYLVKGLHIYGGPQVSFLLKNNVHTEASILGFSVVNSDFNVTDNFRKVDVGLVGGLGYHFDNGLNLGIGYDYGLNTLDKGGDIKSYNRVVKASIGFDF